MQKFDLAVHYFDKHFTLITDTSEISMTASEVQMAVSRGNAKAAQFFEAVVEPQRMESLLKWKQERIF